MEFRPGTLVRARNRRWVVQPSNDQDLLVLKPLDGAEEETTGIFKPLMTEEDKPVTDRFPLPESDDIGDISSVKLLYDSVRFSFRNGAGPFRSFGKLSFRPRAFQLVPLVMALRQEVSRLLIADDVGIGKTVESLLIVKELLERRVIERFAVVAPPHLCDQWQREIHEKFNMEPVVIRSESAAKLEREVPPDVSPFEYYPCQVISIDYIKMDPRKRLFLSYCPEMLIVDEAHTCARPPGQDTDSQMRHELIREVTKDDSRHTLLLTATPHNGFEESFQSLLGLIKPEFSQVNVAQADQKTRRNLARHFVQRRRGDVARWLDEETRFPERDEEDAELEYTLSTEYQELFQELLDYSKFLVKQASEKGNKVHYWAALGLMRGVISSPAAGVGMLRKRAEKKSGDPESEELDDNSARNMVMDPDEVAYDGEPSSVATAAPTESSETGKLNNFADRLEKMQSLKYDLKLKATLNKITAWLEQGYHPIIFCRYISTAEYVAKMLADNLPTGWRRKTGIQPVTGLLSHEQRKERVDLLGTYDHRILVATDCLSEGINLQEHFTAVLHYDLPWNPNKLEQREGRVDRFGQSASTIKASLLYGSGNPIDATVLKVLLRKARTIRKNTGISVPFPDDSESIMQAVMNSVLLNPHYADQGRQQLQLTFEGDEVIEKSEKQAEVAYERARKQVEATRSIFAQHAIKSDVIEQGLKETDQALGTPEDVQRFVSGAMERLGVEMQLRDKASGVWTLIPHNLPERLKMLLPESGSVKVGFKAPLPEGVLYLGRNHQFVEQLSREMTGRAFRKDDEVPARAAVIRTDQVKAKTSLFLLRVRNVIRQKKRKNEQIAEEMLLWGYRGEPADDAILTHEEVNRMLNECSPTQNMEYEEQQWFLEEEIKRIQEEDVQRLLQNITAERTEKLIESHERYQETVGGAGYTGIEPVLPPDVIGVYILLPQIPGA